jgi:hypothetical protein
MQRTAACVLLQALVTQALKTKGRPTGRPFLFSVVKNTGCAAQQRLIHLSTSTNCVPQYGQLASGVSSSGI